MKTITIYELLGLVKDGKAPKKIKYEDDIYELTSNVNDYYNKNYGYWFTNQICSLGTLNDEVEILEDTIEDRYKEMEKVRNYKPNPSYLEPKEEKKIPERIELEPLNLKDDLQRQIEVVHYENIMISNAVNEIIYYLEYLKSKGDE